MARPRRSSAKPTSTVAEASMPVVRRQDGETRIVLGPGVVDGLWPILHELGATRAFLVTGASLAAGPVGARVRAALGVRLGGTYTKSKPHVPQETAADVSAEAGLAGADVLVGLGGGSPIGTAKAAAVRLQETVGSRSFVAAIPTTYAGSEVTPVYGTTDRERGRKSVVRNPAVRPRLALYDPELALDTPPDLTASTGVNALAHCVEGLYSTQADDAVRGMALRAARGLIEFLPDAVREPRNVVHRYRLFEGSMEAGLVLTYAGMGVHHGLCHVLGGRFNAPHGLLNAIVLPHAMRFNIPIADAAYRALAPALGLVVAEIPAERIGERVCQATADFIRRLGIPQRLRDLGIPKDALPSVAEEAMESKAVRSNPRPLTSARDALAILEASW